MFVATIVSKTQKKGVHRIDLETTRQASERRFSRKKTKKKTSRRSAGWRGGGLSQLVGGWGSRFPVMASRVGSHVTRFVVTITSKKQKKRGQRINQESTRRASERRFSRKKGRSKNGKTKCRWEGGGRAGGIPKTGAGCAKP